MSADVDVLVVGGGPIGLAAAIEARLAGLSAVVVEPRTGVVDKACGEGVMPGAVAALERLDVRPAGRAFHGFSYRDARRHVEHRLRCGAGLGVRRTTLHAALAARAAEVGATRVQARVTTLEQDADGVTAAGLRARWLLGCDGLHSTVRRLAGLDRPARERSAGGARRDTRRFGLRRHFRVAPWTDLVEVHWTPLVEAYVTPVADDLVGIALLGPPGVRYDAALAQVPELAARVSGSAPATAVRGAGPLRQRSVRRTAGRVLLVGDASGYVDALTGEGLRVGLAQAQGAVRAVLSGDPSGYERTWARATRELRFLTAGLVAVATSPARPAIVPLATRLPGVFGALVERLSR